MRRKKIINILKVLFGVVFVVIFLFLILNLINSDYTLTAADVDFSQNIRAGDVWTYITLKSDHKYEITLEEIPLVIERWQQLNPDLEILDIDLIVVNNNFERLEITHRPKTTCS
ncbi:MAG: hypothetical protein MUP45_04535 [Candidatus Marinimicrobia bacterium]|nr:hypothetical protein [Candidatus Neomarinimicrobiota bacterium]